MKNDKTVPAVRRPGLYAGAATKSQAVFYGGFFLLIFIGPLLQGLYYEIEFMPVLFLLGLVAAGVLLFRPGRLEEELGRQPLDWIMAGLLPVYLLALITAVHRHQAVVGVLQVCSYFLVYWLAVKVGRSREGFKGLLIAVYLAAIVMAAAGLAAALGWVNWPGFYAEGQIRSTFQYHNALAVYLAVAGIIGWSLSLESRVLPYRLLWAAGNYIIMLVIIGTLSRGTWLLYPPALALFIGSLHKGRRSQALLALIWTILCALLTSRYFFEQIGHSSGLAFGIMVIGLAASLAAGITADWLPRFRSLSKGYRAAVLIGLAGVLLVLSAGLSGLGTSGPGNREMLPRNVVNRAQQTSFQENSIQERLASYRDALKIIRDHPVTGCGGGGWAAVYQQYVQQPYYTRELHNYYLKVGVEAGILGLIVLIAGAVLFCRLWLKARRREKDEPWPPMFWGAACGFLLLALHAAIDFELSLPGVAFLFFALLGVIRGFAGDHQVKPKTAATGKGKRQKPAANSPGRCSKIATITLWGVTAAVVICSAGWLLAWFNAKAGVEALAMNKLTEARDNYRRAVLLAPDTPQYRVGLAMTAARMAVGEKEGEAYREAVEQARAAARLEPYGLETRLELVKVYVFLGLPRQQIEECKALVIAAPHQIKAYELAADSLLNAAWSCLMQSDMDGAGGYLLQLLDVRNSMTGKIATPSARLNLASGQAALLLGRWPEAATYLREAATGKGTGETARYWLAVMKDAQGLHPPGLVPEIPPDILRDLLNHR